MVQLSYHPIKSELYRVQSFVNYIMLEVVLKASKISQKHFSTSLVIPRYRALIDGVNKKYLLNPLKIMYDSCKILQPYQIKVLRRAVYCNNKIEELCEGRIAPVHYSELEKVLGIGNKHLIDAIKDFCNALYDSCLKRKPFENEYGSIRMYYKNLVGRNSNCIMCGMMDVIDTELDDTVSAFDHYLPRALYPFNSVNLLNLVPTCEKCNGKCKKAKDPLFDNGTEYKWKYQLKCFYPFSELTYLIIVMVKFASPYKKQMPKEDINVTLSCKGHQDKVDNWDRIYNIRKRYGSMIANDNYYDFYLNERKTALERCCTMERLIQLREKNMEGDMNFLKVPFLRAAMDSIGG